MTTTSLRNVTISSRYDDIYYEVRTPPWEPELTKIKRRDPDLGQFDLVGEMKNVIGDFKEDAASDETRVSRSMKVDKGKGKAREDDKENADVTSESGKKIDEKAWKRRGKPIEVRVWGGLYRGLEEWLPRGEGQDRV